MKDKQQKYSARKGGRSSLGGVILGVAVGVVAIALQDPLFSDAWSARENPAYDAWMEKGEGGGARRTGLSLGDFRECRLTNVAGEMRFMLPDDRFLGGEPETIESIERVPHGGVGRLGRGRLEVRYLGVGYDLEYRGSSGSRVFPVVYGIDGERIKESEVEAIRNGEPPREVFGGPDGPRLCVGVGAENVARFEVVNFGLFDARTKWSLMGRGCGITSVGSNLVEVETRVPCFHVGPVELFLEVWYGETAEVMVAPESMTQVNVDGAPHLLLGALDGCRFGAFATPASEDGLQWVSLKKDDASSTFVMATVGETKFGCELKDGRRVEAVRQFQVGGVQVLRVSARLNDIEHVVVRPCCKRRRFVFELDSLPGQPHVDESERNMADRRIPYARFFRPKDMLHVMAANMDAGLADPNARVDAVAGFAPFSVTNATPREIAALFLESTTNYDAVVLDRRRNALVAKRPLLQVLREKLAKLLD